MQTVNSTDTMLQMKKTKSKTKQKILRRKNTESNGWKKNTRNIAYTTYALITSIEDMSTYRATKENSKLACKNQTESSNKYD